MAFGPDMVVKIGVRGPLSGPAGNPVSSPIEAGSCDGRRFVHRVCAQAFAVVDDPIQPWGRATRLFVSEWGSSPSHPGGSGCVFGGPGGVSLVPGCMFVWSACVCPVCMKRGSRVGWGCLGRSRVLGGRPGVVSKSDRSGGACLHRAPGSGVGAPVVGFLSLCRLWWSCRVCLSGGW
jgi:hypothetical protein